MNRKLIISLAIIVLSLLGELLLWNYVISFSLLLVFLAYVKHKIYPIKKELLWYIFICLGGAIIEVILVNFGHGWKYVHPNVLGIPFWIPVFWGLIGTTIIVMYDGFTQQKQN